LEQEQKEEGLEEGLLVGGGEMKEKEVVK